MGWNDLQEPIPGTRRELFDRVTARGRWLRQRRQMTWAAAGVVAVLAVAVPAASLVDTDGDDRTDVAAVAPPESLFSPATGGLPAGTAPETPPPEALPSPGTTMAGPAPGPTTARPSASNVPPLAPDPAAGPSSLTGPPLALPPAPKLPPCTAADVEMTLTPEKPSWGPSEPVKLTFAFRNRSDHVCTYNASLGLTGYDASGTPAGLGFARINEYFFGDLTPIGPGEVVSETLQWEHYECEGSPAVCTPLAPGVYRIVVTQISTAEATVTLT